MCASARNSGAIRELGSGHCAASEWASERLRTAFHFPLASLALLLRPASIQNPGRTALRCAILCFGPHSPTPKHEGDPPSPSHLRHTAGRLNLGIEAPSQGEAEGGGARGAQAFSPSGATILLPPFPSSVDGRIPPALMLSYILHETCRQCCHKSTFHRGEKEEHLPRPRAAKAKFKIAAGGQSGALSPPNPFSRSGRPIPPGTNQGAAPREIQAQGKQEATWHLCLPGRASPGPPELRCHRVAGRVWLAFYCCVPSTTTPPVIAQIGGGPAGTARSAARSGHGSKQQREGSRGIALLTARTGLLPLTDWRCCLRDRQRQDRDRGNG